MNILKGLIVKLLKFILIFLISSSVLSNESEVEFKFNKKLLDRSKSFTDNFDIWINTIPQNSKSNGLYETYYSFSIPYYHEERGKYIYPFKNERDDVETIFIKICKKIKGKEVTAVVNRDDTYTIVESRYVASTMNRPFKSACLSKDGPVSLEFDLRRNRDVFAFYIRDVSKYEKHLLKEGEERRQREIDFDRALREKKAMEIEQKRKLEEEAASSLFEKRKEKSASFQENLVIGDVSTLGMIIEIRRPIAKVQLKSGEEEWFKINVLLPEDID